MSKRTAENRCRRQPADQELLRLLEHVDAELAEAVRREGCRRGHGGKLHRASYRRKPRGGPSHWDRRHSFCCELEGCRQRHTPPSVRYLGPKVYVGFVVVLLTAMHQGLTPWRLQQLGLVLPEVGRRTWERWRKWWRESFVATGFWKVAQARFSPPLSPEGLPLELCERFPIDTPDGLVKLLRFLSPITTGATVAQVVM